MCEQTDSSGKGLCKATLLHGFWASRSRFLGYIGSFTGRSESVEDIFQEACAKFLASKAAFSCLFRAESYFYRILRSVLVDGIRKQRGLQFTGKVKEPTWDPQNEWNQDLLIEQVREAAATLSSRQQQILNVLLDPSLTRLKERCEVLHLACGTVWYHRRRIAKELRRKVVQKS